MSTRLKPAAMAGLAVSAVLAGCSGHGVPPVAAAPPGVARADVVAGVEPGRADAAARDAPESAASPPPDELTGTMVDVPGGSYCLGCSAGSPTDSVTLAPFKIDRTEVTQAAYQVCVEQGPCLAPLRGFDPERLGAFPVTSVKVLDAVTYCWWAGKHLPGEAEWEAAARGQGRRRYPWGDDPPDCRRANLKGCGDRAQAAGSWPATRASPVGALDMAGNVAEWVAQTSSGSEKQLARVAPGVRITRGGSFLSSEPGIRTDARDAPPEEASAAIGFRCAR